MCLIKMEEKNLLGPNLGKGSKQSARSPQPTKFSPALRRSKAPSHLP